MTDKYAIVRPYLKEVLRPWTPVSGVTTSHRILFNLSQKHGSVYIQSILDAYFEEYGPNGSRDPLNEYA